MFYNIPSGIHSNGFDTKIDFFTYGDIHGRMSDLYSRLHTIYSVQAVYYNPTALVTSSRSLF